VTKYSKETAEAILEVGNREEYMEFRPDGVWTTKEQSGYEWTPACDLDGPNAPDPLTTPSLPFPFSANELAAFMLDGIGWFTVDALGGWDEGPAPVVMASMGIRGIIARQAVEGAYQAYRDAETVVGRFDGNADAHVQRLDADYEEARLDSLEEHGVGEAGITEAKRDERVKLAYAAIADKLASLKAARMDADSASGAWRRAMVRQLLQPQADLAPEAAAPTAPVAPATAIDGAVALHGAPEPGTVTHSTKAPRRDTLTPVIELAQSQCRNRNDTAEVWACLLVIANKKTAPFIGTAEGGLQYLNGAAAAFFKRDALDKRLHPEKRGKPGKRR